jgi:hypothetical protein
MPPDPFQLVEVPITGGLDQKTDSRKVPAGKMIAATNIQRTKDGRIQKRYGTGVFSREDIIGTITVPVYLPTSVGRLGTHGEELLAVHRATSAGYLYSLSETAGKWRSVDRVSEWDARQYPIMYGPAGQVAGDIAYNSTNKLFCYVWTEPTASLSAAGNIVAMVVDEVRGGVAYLPTVLGSGVVPRVLDLNGVFVVTYTDLTGNIKAHRLPQTTYPLAWGSASTLRNDASIASGWTYYDIASVSGSSLFYLVYEKNGPGPISLYCYNSSFVQQATGNSSSGHSGIQGIAIDVTHDTTAYSVSIAWHRYTGGFEIISFEWWDPATCAAVALSLANASSIAFASSSTCLNMSIVQTTPASVAHLAWSTIEVPGDSSATDQITLRTSVVTTSATVTGTNRTLHHAYGISRIFTSLGSTWMVAATGGYAGTGVGSVTGTDWTVQLLDLNFADTSTTGLVPRPVCTVAPRTLGRVVVAGALGHVVTDGDSRKRAMIPLGGGLLSFGVAMSRYQLGTVQFDSTQRSRQMVELGGLTYITGGVPSWYDGARVGEIGFLYTPHVVATVIAGAGMGTGAYRYGVIYCQLDAAGNIHRSAPYYVNATTTGGNNQVELRISLLSVTTRQDTDNATAKPWIEIYRSAVNATTTLYRRTSELVFSSGVTASSSGTLQNSTTTGRIVYTDDGPDSVLTGLLGIPFIYTQNNGATPGALDNVCPPSARLACVHRGRLWLAGCPDGKQLWASKKQIAGEAPGFSDGLIFYADEGGDITAIASMDDKMLVFKADRIFYITGDGPTDSGMQSDWSDIVRVNCTVGCSEPNSVVATPVGVLFQSSVGISLIDRSLNVNALFGAGVEDELVGYTITQAVLLPDKTEVRFALIDTAGTAGKELRFDYRTNEWTIAKYIDGVDFAAIPMRAACVSRGTYCFLSTTPKVFYENPLTYKDNGSFVAYTLEFAPLSAAGTLGYQDVAEVAFLLDKRDFSAVTISVDVDGNATFDESKTWNVDGTVSIPSPTSPQSSTTGEYVLTLKTKKAAKSRLVRVKLTDANISGSDSGRGSDVVGLALKVAAKEGPYKLLSSLNKG